MEHFDWHAFDIELFKLANKSYNFQFELDNAFFQNLSQDLIPGGNLTVNLLLDKGERMLNVHIQINGYVSLVCDRTLKQFEHPLQLHEEVYFKYGQEEEELNESAFVIPRDRQTINMAQIFFDLVAVAIPPKKLHPDLQTDEEYQQDENGNLFIHQSEPKNENQEQPIDPRWEALRKLNNN